jgi:hypothetical protein
MHGTRPNSARVTSLVTEANALHARLEHGWRRQLEDARRLGDVLLKLKEAVGRGNWLAFAKQHLRFSDRKARDYMGFYTACRDPAYWRRVANMNSFSEALNALPGRTGARSSVEYYTPAEIIEAARRVLGSIDLDPASNATANRTVRATKFYTKQQNGLLLPWRGRVWLNPPYCGQAGKFVGKLLDEYRAGNISSAIALVNWRSVDSKWFRPLFDQTLCFCYERVQFHGEKEAYVIPFLAYLGTGKQLFVDEFARFGAVLVRWKAHGTSVRPRERHRLPPLSEEAPM